jgi:hypothetical protein
MSITGVGGSGSFFQPSLGKAAAAAQQAQLAAEQNSTQDAGITSDTANASDSSVQSFLKYANEPPAKRMVDDWLKAHGLTEKDLEKMPADKQAAIRKEMAADIKKQIEDQMQKNGTAKGPVPTGSIANIVA